MVSASSTTTFLKQYENQLLAGAITITVTIAIALLLFPIAKNVIVKQVIKDLQANYTPGPYTPGFDMDKVNYDVWHKPQQAQQSISTEPQQEAQKTFSPQYLPRSFRSINSN